MLQDDDQIAKKLNTFFKKAVSKLNVNENFFVTNRTPDDLIDHIEKAIEKHISFFQYSFNTKRF